MRPADEIRVHLCRDVVDFRKQARGLSVLVEYELELDPFSAHLFAFCNRRRDHVKLLFWERNGFVLWQKRLERDRFHWPRGDGPTVSLTGQELNWLLDGFDLRQWRGHARLSYTCVA